MSKSTISAIKRQRTAKLARIVTRSAYLKRRGRKDEMAEFIFNEFMDLGGVYVKFLQGVLLRSEMMRKWNSPRRHNVFENIESEHINLSALLQAELPPEKLAQIAQVQPQPFAAGSFGQVYFGTLRDGSPIIIKALRPLIRETLTYDLRLLGLFAKQFFVKLYPNISINIDDAVSEFKSSTMRETDYVFEANFAAELHEAFSNNQRFIVPKTYLDLCTPSMIVQEYVGGFSVAQLIKLQAQGVDPAAYVEEQLGSNIDTQLITVGYEYLYGFFTLPRIQGDPHPGNIKLLPDNKVALIDFGIAAPAPRDKHSFFSLIEEYEKVYQGNIDVENLFGQFLRFFVSDLYKALKKLSSIKMGEDAPDLTRTLGSIAHQNLVAQMGQDSIQNLHKNNKNILTIINQMVNKQNRFGLIMNIQSSEMLRAAQTYVSLVESLGRQDYVLPIVFTTVMERVRREMPELAHDTSDGFTTAQALEIVSGWLERVAVRDPALFRSLMEKINGNIAAKKIEVKNA